MALTEAQKQQWLTEDNFRIVIMDLEYHDGVSKKMLRFSSYPYVMPIGDTTIDPIDEVTVLDNLVYDDIISNVPNIITRLDSDQTLGGIDLLNTDGEYDDMLSTWTIVGHKILLYIGDNNWSRDNFIPILDGVISGITSNSPYNIQLQLRDKKEALNVPLQGQVYHTQYTQAEWDALSPAEKAASEEYWHKLMDEVDASHSAGNFQGTIFNSIDGDYDRAKAVLPEATHDTHVPICLGKCFNIEPILVDSFNHIYHIHDSDEGIESIEDVRSNGVPLLGPNPRQMVLTDASNGGFIIGDIITDNDDINIQGRVFEIDGTAPTQTINYYPLNNGYDFSATSGTFTANLDSEPELNPDTNLLIETNYDLITWASSWTWASGKLSVNQASGSTEWISINYQEIDTVHGQYYVVKVVVENYVDAGTGAWLRVQPGYAGTAEIVPGNGTYQFVLYCDHTSRLPGEDAVWIESNGGTVSLTADVTFWSIRDLNTSAAQATAVDSTNIGTIIHRMDIGTFNPGTPPRWSDGFLVGEVIQDDSDSTIYGTITGTSGQSSQGDYVVYYTPNNPSNDFSALTGTFTGLISDNGGTAVDPIVENDGSVGQYEIDKDLGIIRLLDHPQGTQITCDVVGQNGRSDIVPIDAAYIAPHSAAYLTEWILLEKAGLLFSDLCQETFPLTGSRGFDNIAPVGIYYKEEIVISDVVSKIMSSVGGFIRFKDAVCKLQLIKLVDPVGETPDLYLIDDDILENGVSLGAIEEPKYAMTLGFRKNWKTQDEGALAGVIAEAGNPYYKLDTLNSYKNDYSTLYKRITSITLDEYPLAEDAEIIETFIYSETDAQDELDRRTVLRSQRRRVIQVQSLATSFTYDIGDIVNITHNRFGLSASKNAVIIGIEESPTSNRVNLDLWL